MLLSMNTPRRACEKPGVRLDAKEEQKEEEDQAAGEWPRLRHAGVDPGAERPGIEHQEEISPAARRTETTEEEKEQHDVQRRDHRIHRVRGSIARAAGRLFEGMDRQVDRMGNHRVEHVMHLVLLRVVADAAVDRIVGIPQLTAQAELLDQ